jgi:pyrimidine operon attenuation protein/uracil phosphoribosyltransferase
MATTEPESRGAGEFRDAAQIPVEPAEFSSTYATWRDAVGGVVGAAGRWAIVGIKRRGAALGRRLWNDLNGRAADLAYGEVDISLYRDDYHLREGNPQVLGTEIPFSVDDASILLVDDVLFTGRTVRAAMDLILDFGRPKRIWLAVLVDRGHRELPIAADLVGLTVTTEQADHVLVRLREVEGEGDAIQLFPGAVDTGKTGGENA